MSGDVVKIEFPAKPDYILAVRLAISAVAERVGFNIEDIEDLKVAVAEACMLLLGSQPDSVGLNITISDGMRVDLEVLGEIKRTGAEDESAELSRCLLEALVDECTFLPESNADGRYQGVQGIRFYKKL